MKRLRKISVAPLLLVCGLLLGNAAFGQDQGLSESARWLQQYLRLDTTNPPGNEYLGAGFLVKLLAAEGIEAQLLVTPEGRTSVYARLEGGGFRDRGQALLLLHHMDVVPPGSGWSHEPFSGDVEEGVLWGRGAIDVKSLGIAHLAYMIELKRRKVPLARDVIFLGSADEESGGGQGVAWLLEHRPELFEGVGAVLNEGGANRFIQGRLFWWG